MTEIIYKYRTTENFKYFVDIILNNRLYAAKYNTMNDPMEGQYLYKDGALDKTVLDLIYSQKEHYKLCSLSKKSNNFLMWSHYANGHRGVAIGVRIDNTKYTVKEIDYVPDLTLIENFDDMTAINILSKKLSFWSYEEEIRAFTESGNYIDVKVEEFGFIKKLVGKINPTIKIIRNTD